jgi:hypothetical protein
MEGRDGDRVGHAAPRGPTGIRGNGAALQLVREVNLQFLELLCDPVRVPLSLKAFAAKLGLPESGPSSIIRRRLATCPILLLDAGFADEPRWRMATAKVCDAGTSVACEASSRLAHSAFTCAWIIAAGDPGTAQWHLGMSASCAAVISRLSLQSVIELAEYHWDWITPLRADRPDIWKQLLGMRIDPAGSTLADPGLRAWQLFLGDRMRTLKDSNK